MDNGRPNTTRPCRSVFFLGGGDRRGGKYFRTPRSCPIDWKIAAVSPTVLFFFAGYLLRQKRVWLSQRAIFRKNMMKSFFDSIYSTQGTSLKNERAFFSPLLIFLNFFFNALPQAESVAKMVSLCPDIVGYKTDCLKVCTGAN